MYRKIALAILILPLICGVNIQKSISSEKGHAKKSIRHATSVSALKLERYNGGFFTIDRPMGWSVKTAGKGSTLAFLVRDPKFSSRQIFCFTEVGPFYTSEYHKATEINYVRSGGYPINWLDMPVVQPLDTQAFFEAFNAIADTKIAHGFMPDMPHLKNFKVISAKQMKSPAPGFSVQLIRALFIQDGKLSQGLFTAAVGEVQPYGWGFFVTGITAPGRELSRLEPPLVKSLGSFNLSKEYVQQCMRDQNDNFRNLLKAGRTMSECSDMIMDGWTERNKSDDILAEKRSDAILGKDRYYDPGTGDVYEYEVGHSPRAGQVPLPDHDYDLWMKAPKDGERGQN